MEKNKCRLLWLLLGLLFVPVILLTSCSTDRDPCLEPVTAQLRIAFYQHIDSNNTNRDTLLPNANIVSLDIDSARYWYVGVKSTSRFNIVLSPLRDTARWLVQVDSAISPLDTLTFIYRRKLQFLSNACGYTYFYNLTEILATHNNIDSVSISSNDITTNAGNEHVKIFL